MTYSVHPKQVIGASRGLPRSGGFRHTGIGMQFELNTFRRYRTRQWAGAFVLLAVFARALIPVGFMPTAGHDGVRMALCSAGILAPALATTDHSGGTLPHHDSICPFAQSAAGALLPTLAVTSPALLPQSVLISGNAERLAATAALSHDHAPRGPPHLA